MSTERSLPAPWASPLAISALGASTCFGGMITAASAARAGLSSGMDVPDMTHVDGATRERVPVTGAPIIGVTDGFEGAGRLARMSQLAVEELATAADWVNPRRMACFLALPPLPGDAALRVAAGVARSLGASPELVRVHPSGHEGTIRALHEAGEAVRAGRCDHAIMGACDSWLDPDRLEEIAAAGRLKTRDDPVGFMPGEAAVFLLLERPASARGGREAPVAILADVREEVEESPLASGKPPTGRALARAATALLGQGGRGTVYVDLNGESYRATDWGMALGRIPAPGFDGWARELPAASFGDTGIASPILAAGLATRAFARGYAVGDKALVLSSGDGPARLALLVERPRAAGKGARR